MIEPLRYHNETATTYEVERPAFCISCQSLKSMEKNPNIAVVYCVDCPGSFVPGNKGSDFCGKGAFLCKSCENDKHKHGLTRDHKRQILVVGPGLRKKVVVRGDGMNFPMVLDKVEVSMKARIYHNGKRVHREPTREIPFIVGMSGKCIHVQILGARHLRSSDLHGTADPFIVYSFCGKPLHTTRVRHRTLNPRWDNETVVVPMDEHLPLPRDCAASQKDVFRLEVFDKDLLSRNDFLGHIELHRSKLMKLAVVSRQQPIRIPLTTRVFAGLLHVQLALTSQAVFIKVCAAEDLDKRDTTHLNNACVKVFLGDTQDTLLGMTPVLRHVIHPVWTQHNVFSVSLERFLSAEHYIATQVRFYRATHGLSDDNDTFNNNKYNDKYSDKNNNDKYNDKNKNSDKNNDKSSRATQRRANFVVSQPQQDTGADRDTSLDEFNVSLPDFLGLFRFEVHDTGSGVAPLPLLGRAPQLLGRTAIHRDTVRRLLPQLPPPLGHSRDTRTETQTERDTPGHTETQLQQLQNDLEGLERRSRQTRRFSVTHSTTVNALRRSVSSTVSSSVRHLFSQQRRNGRDNNDNDDDNIDDNDNSDDNSEDNLGAFDRNETETEPPRQHRDTVRDRDTQNETHHHQLTVDVEAATHLQQDRDTDTHDTEAAALDTIHIATTSSPPRRGSFFSSSSPLFSPTSKRFHFATSVSQKAVSFFSSKLSSKLEEEKDETPAFGPTLRLQLMRPSPNLVCRDTTTGTQQDTAAVEDTQDTEVDLGFVVVRLIVASRGSVLQGLDLSVQRMSIGETALVKCRFDLAYGSYCLSGHIPPRACVVLRVSLLSLNGRGRDTVSVATRMLIRLQRVARWTLRQSVASLLLLVCVSIATLATQLLSLCGLATHSKNKSKTQRDTREERRRRRRHRRDTEEDDDSDNCVSDSDSLGHSDSDSDEESVAGHSDTAEDDDFVARHTSHDDTVRHDRTQQIETQDTARDTRPRTVKPARHMARHLNTAVRSGATLLLNYPVTHHETVAEKRKRQLTEARVLHRTQQQQQQMVATHVSQNDPTTKMMMMQSQDTPVSRVARSMTSKLRLLQQLTDEDTQRDTHDTRDTDPARDADNEEEDDEEKDDFDP